jgi:hypothetical protein
MSDAQQAPPEPKEFVTRLAEFRNGLPDDEQAMMDALVAHAVHAVPEPSGPPEQAPSVPEAEQRAFFQKLEAYRDSLPAGQRPLVDAMVVEVGAAEPPDVEAHLSYELWSKVGNPLSWQWYGEKCAEAKAAPEFSWGGDVRLEHTFGSWLPFTTNKLYRCMRYI